MPKALLDACVPHFLRKELEDLDVETAKFAGVDRLSDTQLLDAIEGRFDILITLDQNIAYQQKLAGRALAVIVLRVDAQTPANFRALVPAMRQAIEQAKDAEVTIVARPTG